MTQCTPKRKTIKFLRQLVRVFMHVFIFFFVFGIFRDWNILKKLCGQTWVKIFGAGLALNGVKYHGDL